MSHPMRAFITLIAISAMLFVGIATRAQEVTATITGTVTDPSGAPVFGASVEARDVERGTTYPTRTNDSGVFNLPRLPVGTYEVKVTAQGFQSAKQPPVTLVLNQVARFTFQLRVQGATEMVMVSEQVPVLQTDTAQVGTVIDSKTNDNLPLASRNFVQLTLLTPGAVSIDPQTMNTGSQTAQEIAGNGGGRPYVNGNREQSNNFLLDGIDDNQASENAVGFTPSPDAIQEFNVITQNASAEFGNYQGGVISATIKSGTNQFHGDVFEFFRNNILNANKWENGFLTAPVVTPKAPMRWNLFGGTIGGPIIKNKLFFFGDYEGSRFDFPPAVGSISVLPIAERGTAQGATYADFGADCTTGFDASGNCIAPAGTPAGTGQIFDPCKAGTGVSGSPCVLSGTPQPFPFNRIPLNRLDKAFTTIMSSSLYPQTINNNLVNNAISLNGSQFNDDQLDAKIDYNISEKDRLFGRYSWAKENDPATTTFQLTGNTISEAHIHNVAFDETHTFSPSLLNEFRLGVNYVLPEGPNITFDSAVGALATSAGIPGNNIGGLNGMPAIAFTSALLAQAGNSGPFNTIGNSAVIQKFASTVWQITDNVLWSHRRHNFKFGYQMNRYRLNIVYPGNYGELGIIGFTAAYTSTTVAGQQIGGDPAASFALGLPDSVGRGTSGYGFHQRDWLLAGFAQDDWRVTDSLTLNIGLRYEARTPWIETNNRQVNVNITTGAVEFPGNAVIPAGSVILGSNGFSRGLYSSEYTGLGNFQPRFGFAWDPAFLNHKTLIRGAYSVSSYLEGTGTNLRLPRNPPYTPSEIAGNNKTAAGSTPYTTEAGSTGGGVPLPNTTIGQSMFAWSPTVQPAIAEQWNLSIQHKIARTLTAQIGYVGQKATHLVVPQDLGQDVLNANGTVSSTEYIGGDNTITGRNGGVGFGPNQFTEVKNTASVGTMRYDALQAVLQKQVSKGLEGQISYTWGKCMTNNSGYYGTYSTNSETSSAFPYWMNLYDPHSDWARCYYDAGQVLSAYAVYDLPIGRGRPYANNMSGILENVIGGWAVSPIFSYHAGFPLAITNANGDTSGTFPQGTAGSGAARPNCNGPVHYTHVLTSAGYQWFDASSFSEPAAGTFGDCPAQGPVIGPRYVDIDLSLQKNFRITESKRLQFRADFFNAFNHPNLAAPSGNTGANGFGNSNFGAITGSQDAREIEFALKFYF